jgi:hypothetical protein
MGNKKELIMTKRQLLRKESLLPAGVPRKIRCYDDGEAGDRYTVVFTGNYKGRNGCDYIGMNASPFHPMGICMHGNHNQVIDYPSYANLGKKIKFEDLPEDCQKVVIRDYNEIWELTETKEKA